MDAFDLSLVFVLFSLILTVIVHKRRRSNNSKLPPGSFGWPVIGETIDFLFSNPEKFVSNRMKKYSPDIFKTKIMGEKTAVICGPNGHKFLFSNEEKLFTAFRTHSMQKLFQSYQSNSSSSPSPSQSTRVMIRQPGFLKPEALTRYLGEMDSITQELLQSHWEGKNEIKTYPFAKFLTLTLACRFFLGTNNSERITKLVNCFDDITLGLHAMILNFPGTAFYRANKAAIAVRRELIGVIKEKKEEMANGVKMQDILCHMIVVTDSKGKFMPENEIADKIMGLLVAGYSTVATTITFLMKYVGHRSDIYEKILTVMKYKWELLAPDEKVVGDMMPTPEKGLPIRLHQH